MNEEILFNDLRQSLTDKEFDDLENFLISERTPEDTMDISMLDGFLTALAIGPNTVMPSQWLPVVFGGEEMEWASLEEVQKYMSLIHRLMNSIIYGFESSPKDFQPLFYENTQGEERVPIYDEWCTGFMRALFLSYNDWQPLKDSDIEPDPLFPIVLFGTKKGWELLKTKPISDIPNEDWENMIHDSVLRIHDYWIPQRKAIHTVKTQAVSSKIGRNEPCPCGSGKKFKHCCMN